MTDPIIPFVDPDALDPESRAMLENMTIMLGFVPHSMLTYFHRPAIARAVMGMMGAVFQDGEATLPGAIKGKLGIICSAINGCVYCTSHQCHSASLPPGGAPGLSDEQLSALVSGADTGSDPVEVACFTFARAASSVPASVTTDILEGLKEVLTSAQIVELAAVVGLWKMINTIHDTLHLPIEDGMEQYARFHAEAGR